MPRPARNHRSKPPAASKRKRAGVGPAPCLALILVDGRAIRKKLLRGYEKAVRDTRHTRAQIERYETKDLPEFRRWFNTIFGATITQLRETSQKLMEAEMMLDDIEDLAFGREIPRHEAYQLILQMKADLAAGKPMPKNFFGDPWEDADEDEDIDPDDFPPGKPAEPPPPPPGGDDDFADLPPNFRPGEGEDFDDYLNRVFSGFSGPPQPEANHQQKRLRDIYRALVRRLHPDQNASLTPRQVEWWHQAQKAYEAGDVDQLEIILTLCEIDAAGTTDQTSCSVLQRITQQMQRALRGLRAQLREKQVDPAWNFTALIDRKPLEKQVRRSLESDLTNLRSRLEDIEADLDELKRRAARRQTKRNAKSKPVPKPAPRPVSKPPPGDGTGDLFGDVPF